MLRGESAVETVAGYECSGAGFEMADAGFGVIYGLDGWGSRIGGSELGKKVKELYGKPGLVSSRCKKPTGRVL